jgi:hypothetical protein
MILIYLQDRKALTEKKTYQNYIDKTITKNQTFSNQQQQ